MKIGISGGTFNPIHIAHLAMAQAAAEELGLDRVIFVPTFLPPHKVVSHVLDAKHRFNMVKLAISGNKRFEISDFEIKKGGKSYSIDTVKYFKSRFPADTKFYFIIGQDAAVKLASWKDIDALLKLVTFVVINRPGVKKEKSLYKVINASMPAIDISSSYIRERLAKGKSVKYFLPEAVLGYIEKHKLYK